MYHFQLLSNCENCHWWRVHDICGLMNATVLLVLYGSKSPHNTCCTLQEVPVQSYKYSRGRSWTYSTVQYSKRYSNCNTNRSSNDESQVQYCTAHVIFVLKAHCPFHFWCSLLLTAYPFTFFYWSEVSCLRKLTTTNQLSIIDVVSVVAVVSVILLR